MKLEQAGITFEVRFCPARRGSWNDPPEDAEIEINDWHVSDWDELAANFGTGTRSRAFASVQAIVDLILERHYNVMLSDAEEIAIDDFDYDPDEDHGESW